MRAIARESVRMSKKKLNLDSLACISGPFRGARCGLTKLYTLTHLLFFQLDLSSQTRIAITITIKAINRTANRGLLMSVAIISSSPSHVRNSR